MMGRWLIRKRKTKKKQTARESRGDPRCGLGTGEVEKEQEFGGVSATDTQGMTAAAVWRGCYVFVLKLIRK